LRERDREIGKGAERERDRREREERRGRDKEREREREREREIHGTRARDLETRPALANGRLGFERGDDHIDERCYVDVARGRHGILFPGHGIDATMCFQNLPGLEFTV
jgi:hypothetical protein